MSPRTPGICDGKCDNGADCCLNTSVFSRDFRCSNAPYSKYIHLSPTLYNLPTDSVVNPLTPNGPYSGRTAPLISKRFILYIYSTNIGTEYFKHGINSSFSYLQNAACFTILTYLVPVLFRFYIQGVLKLKKNNSGAKRLRS